MAYVFTEKSRRRKIITDSNYKASQKQDVITAIHRVRVYVHDVLLL